MKIKMIQPLNLGKFNHEEVLEFSQKICHTLDGVHSDTAKKGGKVFADAVAAFAKKLEESPEIVSLEVQANDANVDQAWRGMNAELENHLEHPNSKIRNAAATVYEVWSKHEDPTELPYEEEYNRLKSLILVISKLPVSVLKDAGVDEWFEALKERHSLFMSIWGEKTATDSQRLANQVKTARASLEQSYAEFVAFMDGWAKYAELDEKFNEIDDEVAHVIDHINAVVAEYSDILVERRKNVSKCIEDILNGLI
ncbi:MAG: hypothetical protein IJU23_11570 [Proteobacteria bacterium]|nr:hypothetical protein [Pseudomonadota bacterium]